MLQNAGTMAQNVTDHVPTFTHSESNRLLNPCNGFFRNKQLAPNRVSSVLAKFNYRRRLNDKLSMTALHTFTRYQILHRQRNINNSTCVISLVSCLLKTNSLLPQPGRVNKNNAARNKPAVAADTNKIVPK